MISSTSTLRVRYIETDQMGVVHHANYLVWLEISRIKLMADLGVKYTDIESLGYKLPVISAQIEYKRPAHFDEILTIRAFLHIRIQARVLITYTVHRQDLLLASAQTTHVFINKEGRPVKPPSFFNSKLIDKQDA